MNKIMFVMICGIFLVSLVSAESIGTYMLNSDIELYQTCNNCTYCNFTTVKYPNGNTILSNIIATQDGTYYSYNLDGGNVTEIGTYNYCYDCGNAVERETGCLTFEVTPSGFSGTLGFYFILILIIALVVALGFWIKEVWFVVIGGMALIILGIYSINYGIAGFRDMFITWAIGLFEIGIGATLSIGAAMQKL